MTYPRAHTHTASPRPATRRLDAAAPAASLPGSVFPADILPGLQTPLCCVFPEKAFPSTQTGPSPAPERKHVGIARRDATLPGAACGHRVTPAQPSLVSLPPTTPGRRQSRARRRVNSGMMFAKGQETL